MSGEGLATNSPARTCDDAPRPVLEPQSEIVIAAPPRPIIRAETEPRRAPTPVIVRTPREYDVGDTVEPAHRARSAELPATPSAQVGIPAGDKPPKPPTVAGYRWALDGAGWKLRKAEVGADGKRRERYVARLGKLELSQLKRQHRTEAALVVALTEWVKAREAAKAIE